ncbi:MAG TPA: VCBS repeat-containing protein [Kofleriaceae bacterium]|nr:VCBS repeat-containing protein [Kofleriaceae bacterium]
MLLCLALAACVRDHYECVHDTDCNLGEGGRCEADTHRCTQYDPACPVSQRSYSAHSADLSGACFAGYVTPLDYCAAGQPPAPAEGCAATVCSALPACCITGWSEACVVEAQRSCPEVTCDTRIALIAQRGARPPEMWDLRYDGTKWAAKLHDEFVTMVAYLTPQPGGDEPRFAGFANAGEVVIENSTGRQVLEVDPTRDYHDMVSLDFDRDLRDTLLFDYQDAAARVLGVEVVKLDLVDTPRDLDLNVSARMSFGATSDEHGLLDGYPDGVITQGSTYKVMLNGPANDRRFRELDEDVQATFDASNTPGAVGPVRSVSWADIDGDGTLDVVGFGNSIRVHTGALGAEPFVDLDCDPPSTTHACDPTNTAFNGAILPTATGARILAAPFDYPTQTRKLYAIDVHPDHTIAYEQLPLSPEPCTTCTILAVIVRDLDGDHQPDIVTIDTNLTLDVALSSVDPTLHVFQRFAPMTALAGDTPLNSIRTSVSGAPLN